MSVESLPVSQRRAIPWVLWSIWKNRNKVLYADSQDSLASQVTHAGTVKCNIHSYWRNAKLHSGGAFMIRDHIGDVLHHAREAFTFSPDRLTSELRCWNGRCKV
ncbi:unnamed protein product [Brassica oleracea]